MISAYYVAVRDYHVFWALLLPQGAYKVHFSGVLEAAKIVGHLATRRSVVHLWRRLQPTYARLSAEATSSPFTGGRTYSTVGNDPATFQDWLKNLSI